jgi:hypothetical protein
MSKSFVMFHDEILRILATAVLESRPDLDPDKTTFCLEMRRNRSWQTAQAYLLVKTGDPDDDDKPDRKQTWWKKFLDWCEPEYGPHAQA